MLKILQLFSAVADFPSAFSFFSFQRCHRHRFWFWSRSRSLASPPGAPSSLLLAVPQHLLPLQDHFVEFLQAGLQTLTVQSGAALSVVQRGRAELMERQDVLHLQQPTDKRKTPSPQRRCLLYHRKYLYPYFLQPQEFVFCIFLGIFLRNSASSK